MTNGAVSIEQAGDGLVADALTYESIITRANGQGGPNLSNLITSSGGSVGYDLSNPSTAGTNDIVNFDWPGGSIATETNIGNTPAGWDFSGLPHFHDGLAPDEFPAVLQKGETVIPKGGTTQNSTVNINVRIDAVDGEGVRRVFREKIIPEMKEALSVNYKHINASIAKAAGN